MSHYMTALAITTKRPKTSDQASADGLADHHNGETGLCWP